MTSAPDVKNTDQSENPTRGFLVDGDAAIEIVAQQLGSFVVKATPTHVESLDPGRRRILYGLEVTFTDGEVVFDDATEQLERNHDLTEIIGLVVPHLKDKAAPVPNGKAYLVGSRWHVDRLEQVVFKEVEDRDPHLVLDLRATAHDQTVIKFNIDDPCLGVGFGFGFAHHPVQTTASARGPARDVVARLEIKHRTVARTVVGHLWFTNIRNTTDDGVGFDLDVPATVEDQRD